MPRHGWGRDWEGRWEGQEWWGPGARTWNSFGRKMFLGFFVFFGLGFLALVALGALLVSALTTWLPTWLALALLPVVLVVIGAVGSRGARRSWRPVGEIVRAAGSLADGDYTARVPETGPSAVRPVARSFNEMARRLETADEQRRRLLADLGHELRTPLTVIRGEIEAMLDGVHRPDPEHLELLMDEVRVMERLLEDLRTLSLAEAGALGLHIEPTDLGELLEDVADGYRRAAGESGVVVRVNVSPGVGEVVVDAVRIREVVVNLVVNALRAMPDGGGLTLRLRRDGRDAVIQVADTGLGIDPAETDQVFERFRKGSTSSGSGLGLTISRDLVRAHGGTISIASRPGKGTTATVSLPLR